MPSSSEPPADVRDGDLLWTPSPQDIARANLTEFTGWLARERGLRFPDYAALWQWSVDDLDAFWQAVWDKFAVRASAPPTAVLGRRTMPGAEWFPGARLNYAEHVLRSERPGTDALLYRNERTALAGLSWDDLAGQVRVLATQLRGLGVRPGDRVVSCLPNIPHAVIAMLATTSIGAIWASCSPDFGWRGVIDRFGQLAPKVLFCADGYRYAGTDFPRTTQLGQIIDALDSLQHVIYLPYLEPGRLQPPVPWAVSWAAALDHPPVPAAGFPVRAGAVRPSAVDPVLLRHHRAAQADHARARRDPAGAAEAAGPAHEPAGGRPDVLLHHHRLDDVELPGQLAAAGHLPGAVRRQPGPPVAGRAVAGGPGRAGELLRRQPRATWT